MTLSFDQAVQRIAAETQPAWLWDGARRRIVFANEAALAHWGETSLLDLIDRRFADADPAAALPGRPALLRDGRLGTIVVVETPAEGEASDPLFAGAPAALAAFDARGNPLAANDEARALLMPGPLGIVVSSPYLAEALLAELAERGVLTRTLRVATRFGLRRCRVAAKQTGARLVFAFEDIEDRLALLDDVQSVPAPQAAAAPTAPPPQVAPEPPPATVLAPAGAALEEVVAALADPTLAADASGHVIAMNAKAAQLLGESARGEPLLNMLPPSLKADAAAYIAASGVRGLERALEDGRETKVQRGPEEIPVRVSFARLATGEILVQFHDLSAGRAAEEALRRAREEAEIASQHKTEFLAKISHELRTPLNAIIGFAEIMEMGRFGPIENPRYQDYVHDIRDSGELLLSLINDLLDLSKAESGRIELDPDAVELKPIVMGVVSLLSGQAEKNGVRLYAAVAKDIPAIVADARSLKQILLNLASNAIKFSVEAGGEVEISATMDAAGAVHIAVRDTGPGMDAEDLKRAMEPYRRTKSGRGREGTGLGLPLARALTEANKAQFALESEPGKGTTARLTFPSALVLAG